MKKLICFLLSLLVVGCATLTGFEHKHGSTVQITTDLFERNNGNIEYKTLSYHSKEKGPKLKLTAGGHIIVETRSFTIGSAKLEYWHCSVMKMNGGQIDHTVSKEKYSIPNYSGGKWWDLFYVYINEPIEEPFKVYLSNLIDNTRNEYIVYPNEKVSSSNH